MKLWALTMSQNDTEPNNVFHPNLVNVKSKGNVILVCEHASNEFPEEFEGLGLSREVQESHAAWDPGAFAVAQKMSDILAAPLVAGSVSRLIYDCNRPPSDPTAMREQSEIYDIPGNIDLSSKDRISRAERIHDPFHQALADLVNLHPISVPLVSIHSFTPVYYGKKRKTEIGLLNGNDERLSRTMFSICDDFTRLELGHNDPYGPEDGVLYTMEKHTSGTGRAHLMVEIRNDLISNSPTQVETAKTLSAWLSRAIQILNS